MKFCSAISNSCYQMKEPCSAGMLPTFLTQGSVQHYAPGSVELLIICVLIASWE